MKRIFTTLFAVLFVAFTYAQNIPNNEFENWTGGKPNSWDATNISLLSVTTVTEETASPQSGSKSCKIETKSSYITTIPGLITLGTFDYMSQSISGGIPFPYRPSKLKGYYKYSPSGADQCFIGVGLSKIVGGVRDTIGQGLLQSTTAVTTWTLFEQDITWTSTDDPDSLNIIISSSNLTGSYVVGSILYVDSLFFEFLPVGMNQEDIKTLDILACYPNPFSGNTTINFASPENAVYEFSVMNMIGVEVHKAQVNAKAGENIINFSAADLPTGLYLFSVKNGKYCKTQSFIVR
ncbi:MAG: hypothetical protein BWY70_01406 [Bacteroidetes bacterium ADurb.Bin408]|nr:MAG: hypothetical protein BWY70_01406 [Bacteroidetes bacterium ADurb.Bin408]